ncbi:MAG: hypothetical protein WAL12_21030 [Trebonia sp.]
MSAFVHILAWVGAPASLALAIARTIVHLVRAWLLAKAGSAALEPGDVEKRRQTALEIVKVLNPEREPWFRAILPWRRPDDDHGP